MDAWTRARDPGQTQKVENDLVEDLVVGTCAVLSGADIFVESRSRPRRCWTGLEAARSGSEIERDDRPFSELPATLAVAGGIVTIDTGDAQPNIAKAIRVQGAHFSSLLSEAERMNQTDRHRWRVGDSLRGCMDVVVFEDEQMRVRTEYAAHVLAVLRQFVLNLLCIALVRKKGGVKDLCPVAAPFLSLEPLAKLGMQG